jgi:hypothetical protein
MMEQDAAPAGGDGRTPAPGRPGNPSGGHYDPSASSSLDWDWPNASSQEARTRGLCLWPRPEARAALERREAPAFSKGNAARRKDPVRRSVLHPLGFSEGRKREDGVPGAAKNTGALARPFGIRAMTRVRGAV